MSRPRLLTNEIVATWNQLTSEEVDAAGGDREKLETLLQEKCAFSRPCAEREMDRFFSDFTARLAAAA